ncbi:MAG TPA: EF-hand domain-containing protein [Steroidobacteraceae bacterium]|jgi:EF-hand domain pair|nr:EF-hand domain-containing protein [Steroidobacteraceae bacterium]
MNATLRCAAYLVVGALAVVWSNPTIADDMVSFATGGYATGLRTKEMMHKIDTDGDGMISKEEWMAFQEKVFAMLDKNKTGKIDVKEFTSGSSKAEIATFATGGYANGLMTKAMLKKMDTDGDGSVSHDEFIAYQLKVFDMMNTSTVHKGMLGPGEFFATGGKAPQ